MNWNADWDAGWDAGWQGEGIIQPVLPILTPAFRSIDAKSIADVYNRGLPDVPDYEFANRRKFYQ